MEVNQTSLFVSCDTSRFCSLVTRVAPFIHGFKSSRFAVYLVMTREIYRACHFLSFPCTESCFHFLRLQNRSCTTSVSHQTYYTNINLFSSTSLGLYFYFFFLPGSHSDMPKGLWHHWWHLCKCKECVHSWSVPLTDSGDEVLMLWRMSFLFPPTHEIS